MTPLPLARVRSEDGSILVIAIVLMTMMLGFGLALLKVVDAQSRQSGLERVNESSFNLTEGTLYAQSVTLQNNWPTLPPDPSGGACDPAAPGRGCAYGRFTAATNSGSPCTFAAGTVTGPANQCPVAAEITKSFSNVDAANGSVWAVQIRDNRDASGNATTVYDRTAVNAAACQDSAGASVVCTWDANGDRRLWIRATGTVRNKTRTLVSLLQLERIRLPFPGNALTAQSVKVTNNGQDIVVATGSQVVLRCGYDTTTTTAAAKNASTATVSVADTSGMAGNPSAMIAVPSGSPSDTVTITTVSATSGPGTVTFTSKSGLGSAYPSGSHFTIAPGTSNTCNQWNSNKQQVQADQILTPSAAPPAMTDDRINQALADPTAKHYTACPNAVTATPATWSGTVIIDDTGKIDPTGAAGACIINLQGGNAGVINGPVAGGNPTACTKYGMIIVIKGTLGLDGNQVFCGVIYMANRGNIGLSASDPPVFALNASAQVIGAVAVDGPGGVVLGSGCGSCGGSLRFDPNAFDAVSVAGSAGLVQNTWRELVSGQ
jgi:hypothetical protein